jgi:thioredoxin-dependent peroxiredoxin
LANELGSRSGGKPPFLTASVLRRVLFGLGQERKTNQFRKEEKNKMAAEIGKRFVNFNLKNQDGETVALDDFAGKWLVLYVYPKDDTPGCTIQGKSFTASKHDFDDAGIAVVGVSADDVDSHKNFCNKFGFTIDLLADPNHELLTAAGVGQSEYKGTMYWDRTSFVIDPEGNLRKIYQKVQPDGHEQVLLNDIKEMQAAG